MRFIESPPTFAVDVRSENDYGTPAEEKLAAIRTDYLASGTLVVWDVDPQMVCVSLYRSTTPEQPVIYQHGRSRTGSAWVDHAGR